MFVVIGMSPGNSYFRQNVVNKILKKAFNEYPNVGVLIPDVPAISTYIALGYPANRARTDKAIAQGNALRNKVKKAIEEEDLDSERVRIFDWKKDNIEHATGYIEKFNFIKELYETSVEFRKDANRATEEVLIENPFRKKVIGDAEIETGVHYLLSELAFMLFLPGYLSKAEVAYIYHRPWPPYERLIAGEYTGQSLENIRFIRFPEFQ